MAKRVANEKPNIEAINYRFLKTGGSSIVIGRYYYKDLLPIKEGKLIKLTKIIPNHNEFKHLDKIRKIDNYTEYYSIPDELVRLLNPSETFYRTIKKLVMYDNLPIFDSPLHYFYIDDAGNKELLETLNDLYDKNYSFWTSYRKIFNFSKNIMEGLLFLHKKRICHLDIKPENIMVNTITNKFKIIDFGFSSLEPFDDYINNPKGTPGYYPKYYESVKVTKFFPKVKANDLVLVNNQIPMLNNRKLVYKVDSYCFGRVLLCLKSMYKHNVTHCCINFEYTTTLKLNKIISSLLKNDVYQRVTIEKCYNRYFV